VLRVADLAFRDVLIVSLVASVAFTLLFYWFSAVMMRRNWSYQVRQKPGGGKAKGAGGKAPNEAPSDVHTK
jgi:uncharacterized protein (DUF2062 family)